MKFATKTKF